MTKDMTVGSPIKHILGFAIPIMLGLLFQQFYNIMDTLIVGRTLGVNALAAVGSVTSLHFLIFGFCNGVCAGFSIPVAQYFGAKDYHNMRRTVANAIYMASIYAIVITTLTVVFSKQMLTAMKTTEDIYHDAYIYIVIIFAGLPFTFLYNMLAGIMRSLGDSRTPVVFLAISAVLNIALDFICILGLKMGTDGAAFATVVSQAVSGICCFFYAKKKFDILKMSKDEWQFSKSHIGRLNANGVPMGLQYSITAIGTVILQTAINSLGTVYVASVATAQKVSQFFSCPFEALGSTMATYGGQNVGAKKFDRLNKGLFSCLLLGCSYAVIACIVLVSFSNQLALFFLKADATEIILKNVHTFVLANSAFYIPLAVICIVRYMVQGMGFSRVAMFAGVLELICRLFVSWILIPLVGFIGVCFTNAITWVFASIFLVIVYIITKRKLIRESEIPTLG